MYQHIVEELWMCPSGIVEVVQEEDTLPETETKNGTAKVPLLV